MQKEITPRERARREKISHWHLERGKRLKLHPSPIFSELGIYEKFDERFWKKVRKTKGCWEWTGGKNEHGYGIIGKGRWRNTFIKAHRASWLIHYGSIPKGMCVLHHCDNPECCNPDHLWLGTYADNSIDAVKKGRTNQGEKNIHAKLTKDQVIQIRSLYKRMRRNHAEIARRYNISINNVKHIVYGQSWKHILAKR